MLDCTALPTHVDVGSVTYQLEGTPGAGGGEPLGVSARCGLAAFLGFVRRAGVARALTERLRLPVQQRRGGFTIGQKSLVLLAHAYLEATRLAAEPDLGHPAAARPPPPSCP